MLIGLPRSRSKARLLLVQYGVRRRLVLRAPQQARSTVSAVSVHLLSIIINRYHLSGLCGLRDCSVVALTPGLARMP